MTKNPPEISIAATDSIPTPSIIKSIYCQNSGVLLMDLHIRIFEGHMAYVEKYNEAICVHPFYGLDPIVLIKKLEDSLHRAQESAWILTHAEQTRLRLLTSAIMFKMDCLKQETSGLPSTAISAASAGRLLGLAKWFFFISSQRLVLPIYSISSKNSNLGWQNYKHWLDSAYEVRQDWSSKSREYAREAQQRAYELSLKEIKSESFRRIDTTKVWNWIHIQLADYYGAPRLATMKDLFLNGDLEAHEWTPDDVDDLSEALLKHCDIGNDIMFFIRKRLKGIRELINDFRGNFTLVYSSGDGGNGNSNTEGPTEKEVEFFAEFDKKFENVEVLPEAPKREAYATLGLFLKAQAQWNILSKRRAAPVSAVSNSDTNLSKEL